MYLLLTLFTAGATSLAIVPLMMRLAPHLGMVDEPSARKVHQYPIPRVGGWGIVLGVLAAVLAWAPIDLLVVSYVFGVIVLFAFGAWDDRKELGHYTKFLGQVLAVLPVVVCAGLYVTRFPVLGSDTVPLWGAMVFTIFALIGMANAINHSDGLDGLAGGESVLSLVAIGFLAYLGNGDLAVLIAVAVIGGVFGFLRYNTHPAVVFMGDSGSQVIGFSLGVLALLLTQRVDTTLSPSVVVLLLGLPIADILYVFYQRIRSGNNWFRATKNHVHHRLIERGFTHYEAVVIIYSIQILFVSLGLVLRHQSDWLIMAVYLCGCAVVFLGLYFAERNRWKVPRESRWLGEWSAGLKRRDFVLVEAPRRFLEFAIPVYLVVASMGLSDVPIEFGVGAAILLVLLLADLIAGRDARSITRRAVLFCVAALVVYLSFVHSAPTLVWVSLAQPAFFLLLATAVLIAIRFSPGRRREEFRTTAMDYLIVLVVVITPIAAGRALDASGFLAAMLVLLYGLELMISERRQRRELVSLASLVASVAIALKGFL